MSFELNFEQLQSKLKKILNPQRFRFIVILYPNPKTIIEIKEHILKTFPKSLVTDLDVKGRSYQEVSSELYEKSEGFVYINDFEEILNSEDLYNGFNQRRDKIASHNINLICFISVYKKEELFTKALNVIPDLWEFKNSVLELEKDGKDDSLAGIKVSESSSYSSLGGLTSAGKKVELKRLLEKLDEENNDELKMNLLYQIGLIYRDLGDYKNSLHYFKELLTLQEEILDDRHPNLATSYNNISSIYKAMGELTKALEFQEKALNLTKEILGDKHHSLATNYNNISTIYQDMGELTKALEFQEKALNLREDILGDKHPDLAQSYNNISLIYRDIGELTKALEFQEKSLNLREDILGDKHPDLATSYSNISLIYSDMGELNRAFEYQKKALNIREEILDDKHPDLANSYLSIASLHFQNAEIKKAKVYIDKAVDIFSHLFPDGHPNLDAALSWQKEIYSR